MYKVTFSFSPYQEYLSGYRRTKEYETVEDAVKAMWDEPCGETNQRLYEDKDGNIVFWSRDERGEHEVTLHHFKDMEGKVWVEYAHEDRMNRWHRYGDMKTLYLKMCELYGVSPMDDFETGISRRFFPEPQYQSWFPGFTGTDGFFSTYIHIEK